MPCIELRINGRAHKVDTEEDASLLYVLRNQLELKAAKYGCGEGYCGSCTVLVDSKPIHSCSAPLWSVGHAEVLTLEALSQAPELCDNLRHLRDLFIAEQAVQCGYCIPGIMLSIYGFVNNKDNATPEQVITHLTERNLCRCGTHYRIIKVVRAYLAYVQSPSEAEPLCHDQYL